MVKPARKGDEQVASYVLENPNSAYAAAISAIYARLLLMLSPRAPKVLLIISAEAQEGKSTTSLSLVRRLAVSGLRVILVDADFRRSTIARLAGVASGPGLGEVLAGNITWEQAIQVDPKSGAHVVAAGNPSSGGLTVGEARRFKELLNSLGAGYDLIILDSPPVLGLADANVISSVADATLIVVRWGHTARRVILYSIAEIVKFGGRVDGIILSKIDVKRLYGYADSGYYVGEVEKTLHRNQRAAFSIAAAPPNAAPPNS